MKKIFAFVLALLLICAMLSITATVAMAAVGSDELPTVTAPDPTEAPEPPVITAMPDTVDAGSTDTPEPPAAETVTPAEGTDEGGTVTILGITTVPAIVILCLLIGYGVKVSPLGDEYIPLIVGVAGGAIGLIAYHVMPDFPGQDPIWAVAIGVASGLAATGVHQAVKQLSKAKAEV